MCDDDDGEEDRGITESKGITQESCLMGGVVGRSTGRSTGSTLHLHLQFGTRGRRPFNRNLYDPLSRGSVENTTAT